MTQAPPIVYPVDVVSPEEDTAPIDLRTGQRVPFKRKADVDAPSQLAPPDRSPSALIQAAMSEAISLARNPNPDESQVTHLRASLTALAILAEKGATMAKTGGPGNTVVQWLMAAIVAAGVALGLGGPGDDTLVATIVGRMDATDKANEQQDRRIAGLEDGLNSVRYSLGKTIEWAVQDSYESCLRDQEEASALNWIAQQMAKRNGDAYKPLAVTCEQNPRLPTEMTDLHTYARRVDDERK